MLKPLLNFAIALTFVAYPFLVYSGLQHFSSHSLTIGLLALAGLRLLLGQGKQPLIWAWVLGAVLATAITLWSNSNYGLLLYPAMINAMLLVGFYISYLYPPSVIEILARKADPNLPAEAIPYIQKVTLVWCAFFIINGSFSLYTVFFKPDWWLLYNGLIAYLLMAVLFAVEFLVRRQQQRKHHA